MEGKAHVYSGTSNAIDSFMKFLNLLKRIHSTLYELMPVSK